MVLLDILVHPLLSHTEVSKELAKDLLMPKPTLTMEVITVMEGMASAMDIFSDTAVDMLSIIMERGRLMLNLTMEVTTVMEVYMEVITVMETVTDATVTTVRSFKRPSSLDRSSP